MKICDRGLALNTLLHLMDHPNSIRPLSTVVDLAFEIQKQSSCEQLIWSLSTTSVKEYGKFQISGLGLDDSLEQRSYRKVFATLKAQMKASKITHLATYGKWSQVIGLAAARFAGIDTRVGFIFDSNSFNKTFFQNTLDQIFSEKLVFFSEYLKREWKKPDAKVLYCGYPDISVSSDLRANVLIHIDDKKYIENFENFTKFVQGDFQFVDERELINGVGPGFYIRFGESKGTYDDIALAMKSGRIPVLPNLGPYSEIILNGENGFLYEPSNDSEVVEVLDHVIQDKDLFLGLIKICQNDSKERFSIPLFTNGFLEIMGMN